MKSTTKSSQQQIANKQYVQSDGLSAFPQFGSNTGRNGLWQVPLPIIPYLRLCLDRTGKPSRRKG